MTALGIAPNWGTWIYRALTFLVISCPCALVISIPLSFFAGIGGASHEGILVKGSNYLEALSKVKTVVMDKTGTLTRGVFEVTGIYPAADGDLSEEEILHLAAHAERHSSHPIAQALRVAFGKEHDGCEVDDVEEIAGHGIRAKVDGKLVCIGNQKMVRLALGNDATVETADIAGTVLNSKVVSASLVESSYNEDGTLKQDPLAANANLNATDKQDMIDALNDYSTANLPGAEDREAEMQKISALASVFNIEIEIAADGTVTQK
jgi:cation transport ATPase